MIKVLLTARKLKCPAFEFCANVKMSLSSNWAKITSLRSRRLEKKRAREKETRESPSRAPVLSFAHYFQAPATQAKDHQRHGKSIAPFALK